VSVEGMVINPSAFENLREDGNLSWNNLISRANDSISRTCDLTSELSRLMETAGLN